MRPISLFAALVLGLSLWSPPQPASAEMYSYVDDKGKVHFTDALHSIPKRYRSRVQKEGLDESAQVDGAGLLGVASQSEAVSNQMTGLLIQGLNRIRKEKNLHPLIPTQRRELQQFTNDRLIGLLVSSVVLTLFAIGLGIHGFLTGRPGWAMANLVLILPVPFYVALHLANNQGLLKLIAFAATLVPTVVMLKTSWELHALMQRLLA